MESLLKTKLKTKLKPKPKAKLPTSEGPAKLLKGMGLGQLNNLIARLETSSQASVQIRGQKMGLPQALGTAYQARRALYLQPWSKIGKGCVKPFQPRSPLLGLADIKVPRLVPPPPPGPWNYASADDLVATCPDDAESTQIRADFNIYFEEALVDNGVLVPWSCSNGGSESSIMLSMYNTFRLAKCIPFGKTFPWDQAPNNLYDWLKGLDLTAIGFFWDSSSAGCSHGWDKRIYLLGNNLAQPIYRKIIDPQAGVGIIYTLVLLAHEARHAGYNIPHNCGSNDTNLAYMGTWAVQYYLLQMLAQNTGQFFSEYEQQMLLGSAADILATRFGQPGG